LFTVTQVVHTFLLALHDDTHPESTVTVATVDVEPQRFAVAVAPRPHDSLRDASGCSLGVMSSGVDFIRSLVTSTRDASGPISAFARASAATAG
jgi:hypothetical protein